MFKVGDKVRAVRFPPTPHRPLGAQLPESLQAVGRVTEIKDPDSAPYPYYLTSLGDGAKPGDLGPYCEAELEAA